MGQSHVHTGQLDSSQRQQSKSCLTTEDLTVFLKPILFALLGENSWKITYQQTLVIVRERLIPLHHFQSISLDE